MSLIDRSALNWKFKDGAGGSGATAMVLGNILHMLFQLSITNRRSDKQQLNALLMDLLKQKQIITQMYEANMSEEFVLKETCVYLASIEKWLRDTIKMPLKDGNKRTHNGDLKTPASATSSNKNFHITNVCDIEESIWSPKYGIKGKLDLTLQLDMNKQAFRHLFHAHTTSNAQRTTHQQQAACQESHVIPVELKSGKTTFSAEHEGQVMLYSLLNSEKRRASDFGLLLYLKDMNFKVKTYKQMRVKE